MEQQMVNTDLNTIPIDKFDAVCANELTKKAIALMTSERDVKEWSLKARKEIKKYAELGLYKTCFYFDPGVSLKVVNGVMKDLTASWYKVTNIRTVNSDKGRFYGIDISWEFINSGD